MSDEQALAQTASDTQLAALGVRIARSVRSHMEALWAEHPPAKILAQNLPYEDLDVEARAITYDAIDPLGRAAYTLRDVLEIASHPSDADFALLVALSRHRAGALAAAVDRALAEALPDLPHRVRAIRDGSYIGTTSVLVTLSQRLTAEAAAQTPRLPEPAPKADIAALVARIAEIRAAVVAAGIPLELDQPSPPSTEADIAALAAAVGRPLPAELVDWLRQPLPGFQATIQPRRGPFAFVGWGFASAAEIRAVLAQQQQSWVTEEAVAGSYVSPTEARSLLEGSIPLSTWESFFLRARDGAVCFYEEGGLVRPPLAPDLRTFLTRWVAIGCFAQRSYDAYRAVLGQVLGLPPKDDHPLIYALA